MSQKSMEIASSDGTKVISQTMKTSNLGLQVNGRNTRGNCKKKCNQISMNWSGSHSHNQQGSLCGAQEWQRQAHLTVLGGSCNISCPAMPYHSQSISSFWNGNALSQSVRCPLMSRWGLFFNYYFLITRRLFWCGHWFEHFSEWRGSQHRLPPVYPGKLCGVKLFFYSQG